MKNAYFRFITEHKSLEGANKRIMNWRSFTLHAVTKWREIIEKVLHKYYTGDAAGKRWENIN